MQNDRVKNLSVGKSSLHFSKSINRSWRRKLLCETEFQEGNFPFHYLGVHFVSSRTKIVHLDDLVHKICDRITGWKSKLLSQGARLIVIRQILMSLPIRLLSSIHIPKVVLQRINRCLSTFFWDASIGNNKHCWCSWRN